MPRYLVTVEEKSTAVWGTEVDAESEEDAVLMTMDKFVASDYAPPQRPGFDLVVDATTDIHIEVDPDPLDDMYGPGN